MIAQASEPVYVVIEGATGWSSPSTLVPLIVSLVALGGVMLSNWHNGRQMEKRDRASRQVAIETEDRRHENDLNRARREHMLDVARGAYVELEGARRELRTAALRLCSRSDIDTWIKSSGTYLEAFHAAYDRFANATDTVNLLGSDDVRRAASDFRGLAMMTDVIGGAIATNVEGAGISDLDGHTRKIRDLSDELLKAMRNELHGEAWLPDIGGGS